MSGPSAKIQHSDWFLSGHFNSAVRQAMITDARLWPLSHIIGHVVTWSDDVLKSGYLAEPVSLGYCITSLKLISVRLNNFLLTYHPTVCFTIAFQRLPYSLCLPNLCFKFARIFSPEFPWGSSCLPRPVDVDVVKLYMAGIRIDVICTSVSWVTGNRKVTLNVSLNVATVIKLGPVHTCAFSTV